MSRRRAVLAASNVKKKIITFYILSFNPLNPILERQAESGMTWRDWVSSDYNLQYKDVLENGETYQVFEILEYKGNDYILHDEGWTVFVSPDVPTRADDFIIDNFTYDCGDVF